MSRRFLLPAAVAVALGGYLITAPVRPAVADQDDPRHYLNLSVSR